MIYKTFLIEQRTGEKILVEKNSDSSEHRPSSVSDKFKKLAKITNLHLQTQRLLSNLLETCLFTPFHEQLLKTSNKNINRIFICMRTYNNLR